MKILPFKLEGGLEARMRKNFKKLEIQIALSNIALGKYVICKFMNYRYYVDNHKRNNPILEGVLLFLMAVV